MTLPAVSLTVRDGALGIVAGNTDNLIAFVGPSSTGTVASVTTISTLKELVDTFGYGPMPEAAAHALAVGGGPVLCVRTTTTTAATIPAEGAMAQTGAGPAITLSGTPYDGYGVEVVVVQGGARATATFKYSLDGGATYSAELVTATTYVIPNSGLTLNFPVGTYVAAEEYTAACTAPRTTTTDLGTALDALTASSADWSLVGVFCEPADATAAAALATTTDAKLVTAAASYRYARGVVGCGGVAVAGLSAAFAASSLTRTGAAGGTGTLTSPLTSRSESRTVAIPIVARLSISPVQEDLGRVASGALPSVTAIGVTASEADTLDSARLMTLRQHVGLPGFYVATGKMLVAPGSDYTYVQNGRVMDKACKLVRPRALQYLNEALRVNANGTLLEQEAVRVESSVNAPLVAELVNTGNAVASSAAVSRTQNLQSTGILPVTVRVRPFGYARTITVDIGFEAVAA